MILLGLSFSSLTIFAEASTRVFDDAGLLSSDEKSSLEQEIAFFKEQTNQDFVFVSTNDTKGKTWEEYADDYYDDNGFGVGDDKNGMLFLIDMEHRKFHISTTGSMIDILNDNRIDNIIESSTSDMADGRYYDAIKNVLAKSESYVQQGPAANSHRVSRDKSSFTFVTIIIASIAGIASALGFYFYISRNYLLKKATYRYPYYEMSQLELTESRTNKVFDVTTTRHIPKPPPSSGSSTHMGGSGTSHGGGSGSF